MEKNKKFTYKTAFYCIRGLLSADLASRRQVPHLLITDLFKQFDKDNDVLKLAKESLDRKKQNIEKEEVSQADKEVVLSTIKEFANHLVDKEPESSNNRNALDAVLQSYSMDLKTIYYR